MENIKTEEKKFAEEIEQTVKLYESYIPSSAIATKQMIEKYADSLVLLGYEKTLFSYCFK